MGIVEDKDMVESLKEIINLLEDHPPLKSSIRRTRFFQGNNNPSYL